MKINFKGDFRNDSLTRKKHSKRIAKLALKIGLIDKKLYDELYLARYNFIKRSNRKNKNGYKSLRYYTELYYCNVDYWGEADEHSIIDHVSDIIYWSTVEINHGDIVKNGIVFSSTKKLIQWLSKLNKKSWKGYEKQLEEKQL